MFVNSSIASLVVPAMCVTMALSFWTKALRRLDLPTLGFPHITHEIPSLRIMPSSDVSSNREISSFTDPRRFLIFASDIISISSSGKSIEASIFADTETSSSFILLRADESLPSSWPNATLSDASVLDLIISSTASAWVRSSLPLRKARFVNSPGSASRAPFSKTSPSVFLSGIIPPWQLISTISSFV